MISLRAARPTFSEPTISDARVSLDQSRPLALGWAAFVACSWTWCIGMYLPVLLVRDYGSAGWLVFMVPNVVGAAAMGWVLRRPGSAADLGRRHWPAAGLFSLVTLLFHAFFAGWIIRSLIGDTAEIVLVLAAGAFYFLGRRGRGDLVLAAALFLASSVAFVVAAAWPDVRPTGAFAVRPAMDLLYLAPATLFGFLLCPYLDLTFLRARASTETLVGVAAFTLGFFVLFLLMVLFTLWYSRLLQPGALFIQPVTLVWIIAGHLTLQSAFTIALHARALAELPPARKPGSVVTFLLAMAVFFVTGVVCAGAKGFIGAMTAGEFVYRLFMAAYALIFPAYVYLLMIPWRGAAGVSNSRKLVVLAGAIGAAAPFLWLGFMQNRMVWVVPGVGILLASRFLLNWPPQPAVAASSPRG